MRQSFTYCVILLFVTCNISSCTTVNSEIVNWNNGTNFETINGVLYYNGDQYNGQLDEYYKNDQKKSEAYFVNGKLNGQKKVWFQNGHLSEERYYSNGLKTGEHKGWWANDSIRFIYHFNDDGQYAGEVLDWFENGLLYREMKYVNGKEVGYQKIWNNTGKLIGNYSVLNGERFGLVNFKNCYTVVNSKNQVGKDE